MEHADTNVHWHCAVWTLFGDWDEALKAGQRHWETLVPSGSLHISLASDIEGLASYMTKEQYTGAHIDAMFVYGPERSSSPAPRRR
ncbi:MAG: hypothetical protein HY055_03100 [Magnetospirillum sp.]|nr:hypothetical protein [Magnetospirillum sp.]